MSRGEALLARSLGLIIVYMKGTMTRLVAEVIVLLPGHLIANMPAGNFSEGRCLQCVF